MIKPEITVFAGPNGSGKSTLTNIYKPKYKYINADEIQKTLNCSNIDAAIMATRMREECLNNNEDFCFETVLSTERNLNLLKEAKLKGYFIKCFFVVTVSEEINVQRVKYRVSTGGHDVPEDKIKDRYKKSISMIRELYKICDILQIYDNSGDSIIRIFKKRKEIYYTYDNCFWSYEDTLNLII
jgi:predicted ABC-type ATPase